MPSSFSRVQLFANPWTVVHQAPLSMGLSRSALQTVIEQLGLRIQRIASLNIYSYLSRSPGSTECSEQFQYVFMQFYAIYDQTIIFSYTISNVIHLTKIIGAHSILINVFHLFNITYRVSTFQLNTDIESSSIINTPNIYVMLN